MNSAQLADASQQTAEALIARGQELIELGEKLLGQARTLRALPRALPLADPPARPRRIEPRSEVVEPTAEEVEDDPLMRAIRAREKADALDQRPVVGKTEAIEAIKALKRCTRLQFSERLGVGAAEANRWLMALVNDGRAERETTDDAIYYRSVHLDNPREHETRMPPEKERPSYELAQATGMPVRIRTERDQRRSRSTPGARQKVIQQDRAYERQEDAKAKRAAAQQAKARAEKAKGPIKGRRKRGSIPV